MKWYIGLAIGLTFLNELQGFILASILRKKASTFGKKPNYFIRAAADLSFLVNKLQTDEKSFSTADKKIINYSKVVFSLNIILPIIILILMIYF